MTAPAAVQSYGFRLESFGNGCCTVRIPSGPGVTGPCGLVAGPVLMAAADFTMWLAMLTRDAAAERAVTVDLTTVFLSSVKDEDVLCTAHVLKWGQRLVVGVADCMAEEGKLLTHHVITYAHMNMK